MLLAAALQSLAGQYFPLHGSRSMVPSMHAHEEENIRAKFNLFVNQSSSLWRLAELGRERPDGRGIFVGSDESVLG